MVNYQLFKYNKKFTVVTNATYSLFIQKTLPLSTGKHPLIIRLNNELSN